MSVIVRGTDYLTTQQDPAPSFDFGAPIGVVEFQTRPGIGPGNTNTIRRRLEDAHLPTPGSSDTIPCETIGLSIESRRPITIDGRDFNVFVRLTEGRRSLGRMTLTRGTPDDPDAEFAGTYTVSVLMYFTAEFTALDGGQAPAPAALSQVFATASSGTWNAHPGPSTALVASDFLTASEPDFIAANHHRNGPADVGDFFILQGHFEGMPSRGGCVEAASQ